MPAAWSLGAITACAPAPSATRRQAPRLCGSVMPSRTSSNGGSCRLSSKSSNEWLGFTAATRATTPWWPWLPAKRDRRKPSASMSCTCASFARSMNWRIRASRREASKNISATAFGAVFRWMLTAWKPNTMRYGGVFVIAELCLLLSQLFLLRERFSLYFFYEYAGMLMRF